MATPYHGAKSNIREFEAFWPNRITEIGGGTRSGRTTAFPPESRVYSTTAVVRSVLTKTLRFPIHSLRKHVEFFAVGDHCIVGQFVDQMQVHHRGLDRCVPKLPLQEHQRLEPVRVPVPL